ncbi:hypothetical protein FG386_001657 [Cryptosporidium ryanae]|uniref:uncharacterized protein n=1 Tax=Cryptosporidium ryanae TaxID=515981 RepID=UPI00351A3A97|nr:hypothetical protein FG386_001657 [Cryptosporidium ryanae]
MFNVYSRGKYEHITTLGLIGVVLSVIWYLTSDKKKRYTKHNLSSDEVCDILISISNEVYPIVIELSHIVFTMKKSIEYNSNEFVKDIEVILCQGGFRDKIIHAQRKVLNNQEINEEFFEQLLVSKCKSDSKIKRLKFGLEMMYEDAVKGIYPILPYLGTHEEFTSMYPIYTHEYIFNLLKELNSDKERRFANIIEEFGDVIAHTIKDPIMGSIPSEELSEKLQEANILSENHVIGSDENKRLFTHAISLFSREKEFLLKRVEIEQEHSENIFKIISNLNK